jgi:hypothetical protein
MEYAAAILAVFGMSIGATSRLRFLAAMLAPVFAIAVIFAWLYAQSFKEGLLIVAGALTILQVGYFLGLLARPFLSYVHRKLFTHRDARHLQQDREI